MILYQQNYIPDICTERPLWIREYPKLNLVHNKSTWDNHWQEGDKSSRPQTSEGMLAAFLSPVSTHHSPWNRSIRFCNCYCGPGVDLHIRTLLASQNFQCVAESSKARRASWRRHPDPRSHTYTSGLGAHRSRVAESHMAKIGFTTSSRRLNGSTEAGLARN